MKALWLYLAVLSCSNVLGQSPALGPARRVRVSGSIMFCGQAVYANTPVRFESKEGQVAAVAYSGHFEVDLPLGVWTVTIPSRVNEPGSDSMSRPRRFRLADHATRVTVDLFERPPVLCNLAGDEKIAAAACWGEESFQVPSAEGVPFEVDLLGLVMLNELNSVVFDPCSAAPHAKRTHRQAATYNLLTVEADEVTYNPVNGVLEANGDVVIHDESGERHEHSAKFRLSEGRAQPLQDSKNK
jgi:hypothetical protein